VLTAAVVVAMVAAAAALKKATEADARARPMLGVAAHVSSGGERARLCNCAGGGGGASTMPTGLWEDKGGIKLRYNS